jgi:tRNA threonylcarbamoyladenosine biosynthesis protein TsaE
MKSFKTNNALETIEVGKKIGSLLTPGDVVLLIGDLSAGKTTITKGIGQALGVKKVINSPTFTIVKGYKGEKCPFYHLDLYRLDGVNNDFDLEEYMEGEGICVIEWPFQVSEILPKEYLEVRLTRTGEDTRTIEVQGIGRYIEKEEAL